MFSITDLNSFEGRNGFHRLAVWRTQKNRAAWRRSGKQRATLAHCVREAPLRMLCRLSATVTHGLISLYRVVSSDDCLETYRLTRLVRTGPGIAEKSCDYFLYVPLRPKGFYSNRLYVFFVSPSPFLTSGYTCWLP